MTDAANTVPTEWLALPDLVDALDESLTRVRRMLDERTLIGSRRNGPLQVPALFVQDGRPLASLRGTVIVLQDGGFSDDEIIDWLFAYEPAIGDAPINRLLEGRKSEVRRVAASLA